MNYDYIVSRLSYCPHTGEFTWKPKQESNTGGGKRWNARYAGKTAGTRNKKGYITINIDKRLYLAHRLAWFIITGEWPVNQLDHINRQKDDNRFENLRPASNMENHYNVSKRSDNKSNHKGVHWDKDRAKWMAYINYDGRRKALGRFDSFEQAVYAYEAAAVNFHGSFVNLS